MKGKERGWGSLFSPEVIEILQVEELTRLEKIKTKLILGGIAVLVGGSTCALAEVAEKSVGLPEALIGGGALTGAGVAAYLGLNRILAKIGKGRLN